ncbi:Ankyrin repeat-containing protein [Tenacibaculum sp. 190524A02b]|uniref:Ankyrin repeat-containing protein n=1 Tax=Tenacibaculum vairaonense TaxID=3137860 RepID=A0ABM9PL27_9FLAO
MFKSIYKLVLVLLFLTVSIQAQESNIFLQRDYWKTNPSIAEVEQKITEGNSVTALNRYGFDAVVYAILEKAPNEVIKHLLTKEGNGVNKLTHDKRTYIFWAAYKNNVPLMKHLIAKNARMDLKDSHQYSPLTFAAATGQTNTEIYDLCIENGIDIKNDVDEKGANALLLLIGHLKNLDLINYFTSKDLSIKSTDINGNGAFNYVAKKGNKKLLEILIKKGFKYKNLNKNGENPILLATKGSRKGYNSLEFFKYLEGLGINPNITSKDGKTPLHNIAYGNKNIATFNYFLNKGVNVNQVDKSGNTPLINAAGRNSLDIIKLLSSKTSDINLQNKKGVSALSAAVERNSFEVVDYLISNNADVNTKDTKGNSLGYYLVNSYSLKKAEEFKKKLNLLKEKGVNLKATQNNNNSLLHVAIDKNSIQLLKEVQKLGIDINAKNKDGLTALHKAIMQAKDTNTIKYLLNAGADKSITTNFGESVHDLAKENELLKNEDIVFLK